MKQFSFARCLAIVLTIASLCAAGCGQNKTSDRDLVSVDAGDAPAVLAGRNKLLGRNGEPGAWVDPRPASNYTKGHIAGAIHMPFANVHDRHEELKKYPVIVVYGDGYRDVIAEGMAKRLIELGHGDVRVLRGGLQAWTAAGNALVAGDQPG